MNTPLILKISAAILFGGFHAAQAAADGRKLEARTGKRAKSSASVSISASRIGNEGSVRFNKSEVWRGTVRNELNTVAGSIDGVDYAAAWDGKEVLWENVQGAAERLLG